MKYGDIGGDMGGPVRTFWWCSWCREEYWEPRGVQYQMPVVHGEQSKRCVCGRKLHRISS